MKSIMRAFGLMAAAMGMRTQATPKENFTGHKAIPWPTEKPKREPESENKKRCRAYKKLTKGIVGRRTWADMRKPRFKTVNMEMLQKIAANRERRQPMFAEMQVKAAKARAKKREDKFKTLASFERSANGSRKP